MASTTPTGTINSASVVILCGNGSLEATREFLVDKLGFVVMEIFPADNPQIYVVEGHRLRIRLQRQEDHVGPQRLVITCSDPTAVTASLATEATSSITAPNGMVIEVQAEEPEVVLPALEEALEICRLRPEQADQTEDSWIVGRAGMLYRDLVKSRLGGRFIASHIRIEEGGTVPDYVHFHRVRLQLIFVYRGWVKLVYEDQGEPFIMHAGDCVLQPPTIRHRVLESSPGLEVVEISCPAEHVTMHDPTMPLPTGNIVPDRVYGEKYFGGQYFTHHIAKDASWVEEQAASKRDLGLWSATKELATGHVVRHKQSQPRTVKHEGEFYFSFVLEGKVRLEISGQSETELEAGDSFVVPAGNSWTLTALTPEMDTLEVILPRTLKE